MTICRPLVLIIYLLLILLAGNANAQSVHKVEFRAIAFDVWPDVPVVSFLDAEGGVHDISLSKLSFSDEHEALVQTDLMFFDANTTSAVVADADATTTAAASVGAVALDATWSEVILVFVPKEIDGRRVYRIHPISSNDSDFGRGGIMFINLSDYAMAANLGEESLKLPAGSPSVVPYLGDTDRFNGQVKVAVYLENNWRLFYSSQWTISKLSKTVVMIYKNQQTGYPLLRTVSFKIQDVGATPVG